MQDRDPDEQAELSVLQAVLLLHFNPDDREDSPYRKAADITCCRDYQDPLAQALEPGNRVLALLTQHDLGALICGHARLDPKYFPRVSHRPRKFFPVYHIRRRSEFFVPARQTT